MKLLVQAVVMTVIFIMSAMAAASEYDPDLAERLGADDYGMSQYILVILKTGPSDNIEGEELIRLQRGHMDNINRLAAEGHLVLAGPFIQEGDMRGLFVFNSTDKDQVKNWVSSDPAVAAGRFKAEYYSWYAASGLKELVNIQAKITRETP